jgi:hypothetical protein
MSLGKTSNGRETVFSVMQRDFIAPAAPQKKRDLEKIEKTVGQHLNVLENKPGQEFLPLDLTKESKRNLVMSTEKDEKNFKYPKNHGEFFIDKQIESTKDQKILGHTRNNSVKLYKEKISNETYENTPAAKIYSPMKQERAGAVLSSQKMKEALLLSQDQTHRGLINDRSRNEYNTLLSLGAEQGSDKKVYRKKQSHAQQSGVGFYMN